MGSSRPIQRRVPAPTSHTSTPRPEVVLARRLPSGLQARPQKRVSGWSRSRMTSRELPVAESHSRIALSQPELASTPPSGRHATPYTLQPCPRNTPGGAPPPRLSTCQRLTTPSTPALASREPPPCLGNR